MKILLVNNTFGNFGGGSEKVTYETGKLLRAKGHKVFFYATDAKPYYEENYEYSHYFPKNLNKSSESKRPISKYIPGLFYNFEAQKNLLKMLDTVKPDIVHFNCIIYNLTPSVLIACKKKGIPCVITFHDSHFACPASTLMKSTFEYCRNAACKNGNILHCIKNKCFSSSYSKSLVSGLEFLYRKIIRFYDIPDAIICPSKYLYDIADKSGINKEKLFVLNNFASNDFIDAVPNYDNNGYFLYVGRLVQEKGVQYILRAFKELPDIKLKIIGDGSYRQELELEAKRLNLKNVQFLGFKNSESLKEEYKNCIATILPSICSEVFGLTILESFAYGKPVIASNIGGIPELVQNNSEGITFTPKNIEELKSAIFKIYNDSNISISLGKNARKKLEMLYSPETHYNKLVSIYEKALIANSEPISELNDLETAIIH